MKKSNLLVTSLTVLSLSFGSLAFAQPGPNNGPGRDDQRGQPRQEQRQDPRQQQHQDSRNGPGHRPMPPQAQHANERGAGPDHNFRQGGRLPSQYRSKQYVVNDWRGHQLKAPPRGYQWVQTGGDYVLAAIATGLIAQVLLGN